MRVLGVDLGRRRIGLAVSDAAGLVARPWKTVPASGNPAASAAGLARLLADDADIGPEVSAIVVGLPRRLNGEDTELSADARIFAREIQVRTGLATHLQDERLSSHEADLRLADVEPDWRVRKARLDAAAAAIILQDHLDARAPGDVHSGEGL